MKILFPLVILVALTGCASKKNAQKEIKEKAAQSTVSDGKALGATIHELIQSSKTLSEVQKKELEQIMAANKQTADALTEESFKYRSVLVKELLSGNIDKKKVNILKKDIKNIESKKLKNTFDTVEKITAIVSKQPDTEKFVTPILEHMDRPSTAR